MTRNPPADPTREGPAREDALRKERRRQVRGLFLLAVAALLFAFWRAGLHHVFTAGWWRLW